MVLILWTLALDRALPLSNEAFGGMTHLSFSLSLSYFQVFYNLTTADNYCTVVTLVLFYLYLCGESVPRTRNCVTHDGSFV